jgi:hypothetical protein
LTPTNLILVDGIAGSGKSSTVHRLGLHLRELGYNARWFFDAEPHHPIYPALDTPALCTADELDDAEWKRRYDIVLENWRALTSALAGTHDIVLLDSSFSETPAEHQRMWNRPAEATVGHILEVERIVAPLDPALIYLYQQDVGLALREILGVRSADYADCMVRRVRMTPYGKAHGIQGYDDVIGVYAAVRRLTDEVFDRVRMRKLGLENSARDWPRSYRAMAEFLGVPPIDMPSAPPRNAERLTGAYRRRGSSDSFAVGLDGAGLSIRNVATLRLIPAGDTVFHVQGTRLVLEFEFEDGGAASAVKVSEGAGAPHSVWRRT